MEDDFFGDTISVELAIERELGYRTKLAIKLKPHDGFLKDLIPLQLQSSTPNVIENEPSTSIVPLGAKPREAPSFVQPQPVVVLEGQKSLPANRILGFNASTGSNLCCKLCNVECSSHSNLRQHQRGQKHKAKLEESAKGQRQWCQVCAVPCMNEECLKAHFQGKKHKAKVQELAGVGPAGTSSQLVEQRQGVYCNVCRVWCADDGCFGQHLAGRKHKLQLGYLHK